MVDDVVVSVASNIREQIKRLSQLPDSEFFRAVELITKPSDIRPKRRISSLSQLQSAYLTDCYGIDILHFEDILPGWDNSDSPFKKLEDFVLDISVSEISVKEDNLLSLIGKMFISEREKEMFQSMGSSGRVVKSE